MTEIKEFGHIELEEVIRIGIETALRNSWHAMPAVVSQDTKDGHVSTLQPSVQAKKLDQNGKVTFEAYPVHDDIPVHHYGGGRVVHTKPTKKGDENLLLYSSRPMDSWHQSGGTENKPVDTRFNHMSDAFMMRGYRSDPRKLTNVAKESSQIRSEDLTQFHDLHPTNGSTLFASDPKDNTKKHTHIVNKDKGIVATSSSNVQHIVGDSTANLTKTLHRLTGNRIHLN
jgi:hypothetical protein